MNLRILKLRTLLLSNKLYYFLFFLTLLFALIYNNTVLLKSKYSENEQEINGIVTNYTIDGNKLTLEFKAEEKLICTYYFDSYEEVINFKDQISLGDKLKLTGELKIPEENSMPNTFDYKKYLYNNKIFYILRIDKYELIEKSTFSFYNIKNYILKRIERIKYNEYLYAFVIGESYYIDEEVNDTYRINGVTHLFALSGSNVSLFAVLLSFILKRLRVNEFISHLIIFSFLILVNFVTGFAPSMVRASVFFFLYGLNKIFYFNIRTINILMLTFVLLVLFNSFIIYDLGFQLSFTITFFLILGNKFFNSKNYFMNLLIVSVLAFIASVPIVIYNFYYINFMSIINNIFYVPYVSLIVFPCALLVFVFPFLNYILYLTTSFMELFSLFMSKVTIFYFPFPKISIFVVFFYYIMLMLYINKKKKMYLLLTLILLIGNYCVFYLDENTYLYFLDVGQGDSILITTPYLNKTILIDTGGSIKYKVEEWKKRNKTFSLVKSSMIPFFNSIGIKKIDYLFLTHGDADHAGNANELIDNFNVRQIFINKGDMNSLEKTILNAVIFNEDYLEIDEVQIYSLNNKSYNNENDNSLVFLVLIENKRLLLMGDASVEVEKNIIRQYSLHDIDILKLGHHGSSTSTSEEFLTKIDAKYAVVSAGKGNKYGHPNEKVINLLNKYNIKIKSTINDNTIIFKLNEKIY